MAAANRIPGIARQSLFASLGWVPPQSWRAGLRALGCIQADDRNTASASGYAVASLYAGYVRQWEKWEFNAFARVDNLFDRRYAGSVIVNEGNARYFELAPGRNWTVGVGGVYRFLSPASILDALEQHLGVARRDAQLPRAAAALAQ